MYIETSFLCFVKHVVYRWILQEEPKLRVGHLKKKNFNGMDSVGKFGS